MSDKTYKLELTKAELELLEETLSGAEDMGPNGNGWKSGELSALESKILLFLNELNKELNSRE